MVVAKGDFGVEPLTIWIRQRHSSA